MANVAASLGREVPVITASGLAKQFFDHSIERTYYALVWGEPDEEKGTIHSHFLKQFVFIKPNLHLSFFSLCTHKKAKIQNRVSSGRKQFNPHLFILSDIWESVGAKAKSRPILRDEKFTFASILLCFVMQLFVFFACGSIEESNFLVSVMQQTKRTAASKERKQKTSSALIVARAKKERLVRVLSSGLD